MSGVGFRTCYVYSYQRSGIGYISALVRGSSGRDVRDLGEFHVITEAYQFYAFLIKISCCALLYCL